MRANAMWLIVCRVGSDALGLLLFVLISRRFGPSGVGEYSYGFAIATLVLVIASLGVDTYGVREYSQSSPARRPIWLAQLLGTQVALITATAAFLCVYLLSTAPSMSMLIIIVMLTSYQMMVALARTLFVPAVAEQHMIVPAVADLLCRLFAVGVAILAIETRISSAACSLIGFPTGGAMLLYVAGRSASCHGTKLGITISMDAVKNIAKALWSYAAAEMMAQAFARVGLFALTLKSGVATTGLYAAGLKLLELSFMPLAFLGVAAYPRLIHLHGNDSPGFHWLANRLLWGMVLISGLLAWGLYFIVPVLVIPVLGAKFAGTENVVQSMAPVAVIQAAEAIMWPMLIAAGLQVARLQAITFATVLSVLLNFVLVPLYGVYGAIVASFLSLGIIVVMFCLALRRVLGMRVFTYIFATQIGSVIAAAVVAWLLRPQGLPLEAGASLVTFASLVAAGYWRWGRKVEPTTKWGASRSPSSDLDAT